MMKTKSIVLTIFMMLLVSLSCVTVYSMQSSISIPVSGMQAEHIALSNKTVQEFMQENFKNPALRINNTVLVNAHSSYLWQVEIIERQCGCGGVRQLDVVKAYVDPVSGSITKIELIKGVSEKDYGKKSCQQECHKHG
jgi:hypothetical protein